MSRFRCVVNGIDRNGPGQTHGHQVAPDVDKLLAERADHASAFRTFANDKTDTPVPR